MTAGGAVAIAAALLLGAIGTRPAGAASEPSATAPSSNPASSVSRVLDAPRIAPPFRVRTLDGRTLELAALTAAGPVVIDFWATWCKPCVASLPELEALHQRFAARGLTVLGISVDGPRNFAKVPQFVNKLSLHYPIALDEDGSMQERYQVAAMPTTIVIGRDGRMVLVHQGYDAGWSGAVMSAVEQVLGPDPAAVRVDSATAAARADSTAAAPDSTGGAR